MYPSEGLKHYIVSDSSCEILRFLIYFVVMMNIIFSEIEGNSSSFVYITVQEHL